jgi:hypothetical protein
MKRVRLRIPGPVSMRTHFVGLQVTLGVDRDLLFRSRDPVTPLPSLLGTDDTSVARGRCGWETGIGIQCESKVESIQL